MGLPGSLDGKESALQCKGHQFNPWSGKIPRASKQLNPSAATTEPQAPGACAPQQKK